MWFFFISLRDCCRLYQPLCQSLSSLGSRNVKETQTQAYTQCTHLHLCLHLPYMGQFKKQHDFMCKKCITFFYLLGVGWGLAQYMIGGERTTWGSPALSFHHVEPRDQVICHAASSFITESSCWPRKLFYRLTLCEPALEEVGRVLS